MALRNFNKTFTAFLLAFAYILLLAHNLVPHHHDPAPEAPAHQTASDHHHDHGHDHDHAETEPENPDKPVSEPGSSLSDHHHSFADNKIHHLDTQADGKVFKKQVIPVLVCFLSFHHYLLRIPDPQPYPPAYLFPPADFAGRAHALRGPPVA